MSNKIVSTAKLLVDKLDGESPSPIMLGSWLAENLDVEPEEFEDENTMFQLLDIMGILTPDEAEIMEAKMLLISTYIAVCTVYREIRQLNGKEVVKPNAKSPTVH